MLAFDIGDRSKFYTPHGRFYLLRDAQALIGVGALQRVDVITAEVQRLYVRPPWRGRGAARLLLDRLLDDARAIGCDVVRLKSLASAHALYRSVGFVEVPPHDDNGMRHYQDEAPLDAYRDSAVLMALRFG
jgi:GNAT superfamily N-acetyltransferase